MSNKRIVDMTVVELQSLARQRKLCSYSRLRRNELIAMLSGSGSVKEFREIARRRGLKGYSTLRRAELLALLRKPTSKATARRKALKKRRPKPAVRYSDTHRTLRFRTALYKAIQSGEIKLDACRVNELFADPNNVKALFGEEKGSASTTLILLGKMRAHVPGNMNIVLKISFQSLTGDNSLEMERIIYDKVTAPLMLNLHTPHIIAYVGSAKCSHFEDTVDVLNTKRITGNATKYELDLVKGWTDLANDKYAKDDYNLHKMSMLLLERSTGLPLEKWGESKHSAADWRAVFFQLCYTLACFNDVGLQHNDLHWGNVFVERTTNPVVLTYVSNRGKTVHQLKTNIIIKLYDFDLSTKYSTKYNRIKLINTRIANDTSYCEELGFCNYPHPKYDLFKILSYMYALRSYQSSDVSAFMKTMTLSIVDTSLLKQDWPWHGSLCRSTPRASKNKDFRKTACDPYVPPSNLMLLPREALERNFNPLRAQSADSKYGPVYSLPSVSRRALRSGRVMYSRNTQAKKTKGARKRT